MKAPQEKGENWDEFSEVYSTFAEPFHIYIADILASQTRVDKAKMILEVACGSGYGSLSARQLMNKGTAYYCTDFSAGMLKKLKERYLTKDFTHNPNNKFELTLEIPKGKIAPKEAENKEGITLRAMMGDNENLPFVDSCFDSYMAPYSLYHVADPEKMLKESHRVLKSGGVASFGVFGKESASPFFTVFPEILMKHAKALKITIPMRRSYFYLGNDESGLIAMAKKAGFSKVNCWHVPLVYPYTVKEFADFMFFGKLTFKDAIALFPAEVQKQMRKELEEVAEKRFIKGGERMEFDTIILTCYKS